MKKVNMLKKILSFSLALALFLTSPASVFAVDAEVPTVEAAAENNEGGAQETPVVTSEGENLKSDTLPAGEEQASESQSGSEDISGEDELNNGRAGSTDLGLEKAEGEAEEAENADELAEADAEADDADACEHADFRYESNGDGTHKKVCKDCDEVVAEAEPCEFDENGKCVLCGYEDPEHKFTLTDENGIVKVTGTKKVLNGATKVVATEITVENNEAEFEKISDALDEQVEKENKSVVDFVAYDVTLYDNDKKVDIQGNVDVVFTQLEVEGLDDSSNKAEVYHYDEEKASVDESMSASTVSTDTVQMSTTHFSTYIVAVKGTQSQQLFESNYVNVSSDKAWNKITSIPGVNEKTSGIGIFGSNHQYFYWGNSTNNRYFYPLEIRVYLDDNTWTPVESIVTDNGKGFPYYAASNIGNDTFTISGKKGYSVKEVKIGASENGYYSATKASVTGSDSRYKVPLSDYLEEYYSWGYKFRKNINYLDIYLETSEPETYNVKVDLFDYEADNNMVTTPYYFNNPNFGGINSVSLSEDSTKPGLLFVSGGLEGNKSDPDFLNKYRADSASYVNKDGATPGIADDKLTLKRNGKITFSNYAVDDLFGSNQSKTNNRTIDYDSKGNAYKWGFYDVEFPFIEKDGYLEFDSSQYNAVFNVDENKVEISEQNNGQFWPMNSLKNGAKNPHFGMHITSNFTIPDDGQDYSFYFSGDDDVWVYIDGELVLDIGGIHNVVEGNIDFKNATSTVGLKNSANKTTKSIKNYIDGKIHEIQFYYLERGDNNSNCVIRFNIDVPTDEQLNANVEFVKKDDDNKPLKDAKFKLSGNGINDLPAPSGADGKVLFANIPAGEYTLEETEAPKGYKKSDQEWTVVVEAYKTGAKYDIYPADGKEDNFKVESGQFVIVNTKDAYEKELTIEKHWVGDTAENRPAEVTFKVYGTYKEGNTENFVSQDGKIVGSKDEFEVTLSANDAKQDDPNTWVKKLDKKLPVFVNNDTTKVITWKADEITVKGYTTEYKKEFINGTEVNIPYSLPPAEATHRGTQYNHIDVELWAATENGSANKRLAEIQNYKHEKNKITVIGYSTKYNGNNNNSNITPSNWKAEQNDDVAVVYDSSTDEFSTRRSSWNGKGSISDATKVVFRVRFEGEEDFRLVVLDDTMTYPKDTVVYRPDNSESLNNYNRICDKIGKSRNSKSINLDGYKIFDIAKVSCGKGPTQGLDLLLTPSTIDEYTVTRDTAYEIHKFTNTKSTVNLTLTKKAVDATGKNPAPNALYSFKVEKIGEDGTRVPVRPVSANGGFPASWVGPNGNKVERDGDKNYAPVNNDGIFNVYGIEDVFIENLEPGKYVITELSASDPTNNKLSLSDFDTRIVVNDDTERINHDQATRAYEIEITEDTTVKFENLLVEKETSETGSVYSKYIAPATNGEYDLTLEFKSPEYTEKTTSVDVVDEEHKAKIDVVVVLDLSASMNYPANNGTNQTRLEVSKIAVSNMVDSVGTDVEARWKLVSYGGWAYPVAEWISGASLKEQVNSTQPYSEYSDWGGTNYQRALVCASKSLENSRSDAKKIIVFITDGEPTYCQTDKNGTPSNDGDYYYGNGQTTSSTVYKGTLLGARSLIQDNKCKCDSFYAVGIGLDKDRTIYTLGSGDEDYIKNNSDNNNLTGLKLLEKIAAKTTAPTNKAYNASTKELTETLSSIASTFGTTYKPAQSVTKTQYATSTKIVDELSQYVDIVEGSAFDIVVKDSNNVAVPAKAKTTGELGQTDATFVLTKNGKDYTFTAKYEKTNAEGDYGKVTLDLASDTDFELGEYTYAVTFKVKPSDAAYDYYAEHTSYPVDENNQPTKGDAGTGDSSAGKEGFFSNNVATATYKFKNKDESITYNKPVVQISETYSWELVKKSASTDTKLGGAEFTLAQDNTVKYYGKSAEETGVVTWYDNKKFEGNSVTVANGTYTLEETKAPEGYAKSNEKWTVNVSNAAELTVKNSAGQTVAVTTTQSNANGVTKKIATLTIENNVAYTLPETGGRGVYVYTIGGVLLMLGACLLLYKNKKNKNK